MKQTIKLLTILLFVAFYSCNEREYLSENISASSADLQQRGIENKTDIPNIERKIIKEGWIRFETTNSTDTRAFITKTVLELNGYISQDNISNSTNEIEHIMVIRVPADNFESLLDKISQNAKKLDGKNINVSDVTEEYIDVEARIKTKKELENRYKELLKQANKVEEMLEIEKEIGNLRTEIESAEKRLQSFNNRISYSTLRVSFYEKSSSVFGFNSKMAQAFKIGWTNLLWFFIAITKVWTFIIIAFITFFVIRRYIKKKKLK